MSYSCFVLMMRPPPGSTRTDTLVPYTPHFRSQFDQRRGPGPQPEPWRISEIAEQSGARFKHDPRDHPLPDPPAPYAPPRARARHACPAPHQQPRPPGAAVSLRPRNRVVSAKTVSPRVHPPGPPPPNHTTPPPPHHPP